MFDVKVWKIKNNMWRASASVDVVAYFGEGETPAEALVRLGQYWYERDFETPAPDAMRELLGAVVSEMGRVASETNKP